MIFSKFSKLSSIYSVICWIEDIFPNLQKVIGKNLNNFGKKKIENFIVFQKTRHTKHCSHIARTVSGTHLMVMCVCVHLGDAFVHDTSMDRHKMNYIMLSVFFLLTTNILYVVLLPYTIQIFIVLPFSRSHQSDAVHPQRSIGTFTYKIHTFSHVSIEKCRAIITVY